MHGPAGAGGSQRSHTADTEGGARAVTLVTHADGLG